MAMACAPVEAAEPMGLLSMGAIGGKVNSPLAPTCEIGGITINMAAEVQVNSLINEGTHGATYGSFPTIDPGQTIEA